MRFLAAIALFSLSACASTKQTGEALVHRHCAEEMARAAADKLAAHPFASVELSEECARDWLYALNQRLGGGS